MNKILGCECMAESVKVSDDDVLNFYHSNFNQIKGFVFIGETLG
jgi:hypothetical protein